MKDEWGLVDLLRGQGDTERDVYIGALMVCADCEHRMIDHDQVAFRCLLCGCDQSDRGLVSYGDSQLADLQHALSVLRRENVKDAMDADRPAGDQPDALRAMVTPREDAEAGAGQKHRPEGSIASLITLDNQSLLDQAHHRACIFQSHPPDAPCIGYAGSWHVHVLGPADDVTERLDHPGNRADGRR